ncbi:hypothetical protein [Cryptosporidium hominis TU502]|uniref:hypothetical protein n=1 Tax=Cryptosporidium hominis (strain TU502) TaxID=353151 RepID=UPI00004533B1|nr:hypothetical protein [Cryptosporidium hominis TU502]
MHCMHFYIFTIFRVDEILSLYKSKILKKNNRRYLSNISKKKFVLIKQNNITIHINKFFFLLFFSLSNFFLFLNIVD